MDEKEYTLIEHLAELRKRLARALIGVAIVGVGAFWFSEEMLEWLRAPMQRLLREAHGQAAQFIVVTPAEYFVCQMKVALVAGLFVASPWVLYQVWMFVAPGLYDQEKRYVVLFVTAGAVCFIGGAVFAYYAVFPTMFRYFVESLPRDIGMMPSIDEHLSFTLKMLLAFGVVFETPVVIFVLSIAGIVEPSSLGQYRRYVVVVAFVVGAVLTPSPDVLSQCLLAGPLLLLYEVGVLVSRIAVKMAGRPLARGARAAVDAPDAAGASAAGTDADTTTGGMATTSSSVEAAKRA